MAKLQWFLSFHTPGTNSGDYMLDLIPQRFIDTPHLIARNAGHLSGPVIYRYRTSKWGRWGDVSMSTLTQTGWTFIPLSRAKAKMLYRSWRSSCA